MDVYKTGLSALIAIGAAWEHDLDLEAVSIERPATAPEDYAMEVCGKWLSFTVTIHGAEVRLALALMDGAENPQTILRSPDTPAGWDVINRLVRAMERHEVQSLKRPIEVGNPERGDDGSSCWIIA